MSEIEQIACDFDALYDLLDELGAVNSPAELQGVLCGKLCAGAKVSNADWQAQVAETLALMEPPGEALVEILGAMLKINKQQLASDDFTFRLLLPDDEQGLNLRVAALSEWCHGFLGGFGSVGLITQKLEGEAQETLQDFADIVQIDVNGETAANGEADFLELVEYVRMAAMSLYLEFGALGAEKNGTAKTLH